MSDEVVLPHVGAVNVVSVEEYYGGIITLDGHEVEVGIAFDEAEGSSLDASVVADLAVHLTKVENYVRTARSAINQQFENSDEDEDCIVRDYIEHHIDEIESLSDKSDHAVLKMLRAVNCCFYPLDDEDYIHVEYSLGFDVTDYVLCVKMDKQGEIHDIDMES